MKEHWNEQISKPALRHRYKWIWQGVVAAVALGLVALFIFSTIFTTFRAYDDEGYFLQTYHEFLSGRVPYDQVYSVYGPFTFCSAALIARFNAVNVTHDMFRWALLPVWIAIASLIAGVVWRWTGRFSTTVVAFLLAAFNLRDLASEVGHPQHLIFLAVALLAWLGFDWIYQPERQRRAFWTGFLIGIVLLCKINIGIFVSVAIALAVSLQLRGRLRLIACGLAMIAAVGLGLLLFVTVSTRSEKLFVFAYLGSVMTTAGFAFFLSMRKQPSLTSLNWLVAGLGTCLCAGVGVTLAWGTTIRALFQSLVTGPALLVKAYHLPFEAATRKGSVVLSVIGIGAAIAIFIWRRQVNVRPAWLGLFKVAVGSGFLLLLSYSPRSALTGSLLLLWLLIVDTQPMTNAAYSNRLLLALLCPLFSLQIFPIAGAQVAWATLLQISAYAVLLGDGISCIEREDLQMQLPRLTRILAQTTGPAFAILLFLLVGGNAIVRYQQWRGSSPVDLPGTHWLRVSPMEKARLTVTVSELKQNCQTVLMVPGVYSFSLWSGVPAAEEKKIDTWPFFWADEVQKNELPRLRQQNQGCVLISSEAYLFWKALAISKGNDGLLSEVRRTMKPIFTLQDITLYRSSQKSDAPANSAVATGQRFSIP